MNKTALVFALAMALLSPLYAVDLSNTNLVGADGLPGVDGFRLPLGQNGPHTVTDSFLTGGSALTITNAAFSNNPTAYDMYGGAGMRAGLLFQFLFNRDVFVDSSTMQGGQGGNMVFSGDIVKDVNAYGGDGFVSRRGSLYFTDSTFYGGAGGTVSVGGGEFYIDVAGGSGIYNFDRGSISLDNVYAEGGSGGSANTSGPAGSISANGGNGVTLASTAFDSSVVGSTLLGGAGGSAINGTNVTGVATADGGAGLSVTDVAMSLVISNSVLTGGIGGTATGTELSTATGGAGLWLTNALDVTIIDSILTGASGGSVNGSAGLVGASLEMQGSTVNLVGGELIGELLFSGSGTNTISVEGTLFDAARQTGGIVNVNDWDASNFQNTLISDGTMNFNNQMFTLMSGSQLTLDGETTSANFNNGLTVQNGGTLNLGLATVTGSDVFTEDGSQINAIYNGTILGKIDATGALTVDSGTTWMIDAGANVVTVDQAFVLATAVGAITNNITREDVVFNGSGGSAGWLGTIIDLQVFTNALTATYGESALDEALGVAGDTSTEFGKAMADFSDLVSSNGYDQIKTLATSQEEGALLMSNSYVRATEMASALVGLQSIVSDQIKDRTRSHLRQQEVGYPTASTPAGSAGWDSMRQFSDRLEDSFGYDEVMDKVNAVLPDVRYDRVKGAVDRATPDIEVDNVTLPASYQTWGRGYGAFIEQDTADGFAGYDSTIGGGILGIDKQINNVLLGIAGGYARTVVEGYAGKDGASDTGHAVAYFSAHGDHVFLDANANYAYNDVSTEYDTLGYNGDYAAHTVGLYLGGGYAITIAKGVLLTPEVSILSAFYTRDAYKETSDLYPDLQWDSYDQWSHLGTVGATLSMIQKIDFRDAEVAVQPELRAHLLHEFNDEFDDETYMMVGGAYTIGASLKAREEDLVKVGAGVRLSKWSSDNTEIGLDLDGTFGDDYNAYVVSGKIMHRF